MKVADRLGPKGEAGGSRGLTSSARGPHASRSICRCLRSHTPEAETSKPRTSPRMARARSFPPSRSRSIDAQKVARDRSGSFESRRGKLTASEAHGRAGVGSWKKRMPCCNGTDTGSEFARRESEQTSRRCLVVKKCKRFVLNRESNGRRRQKSTACAPSPPATEPDDSAQVSQSSLDPENMQERDPRRRVGANRPLRCLSRVLGNSHARFLEGCGGGNAPVPTRRHHSDNPR